MLVFDDYLARPLFLTLRTALLHARFPWEKSPILGGDWPLAPEHNRQLVHGFFLAKPGLRHTSEHFHLLAPLLAKLAPDELLKVKANLTPRQDRHVEYGMHVDTRRPGATTAILYLNSNDGYTVFEDGTQVASVANRLLVFDAARRHTGASCTDAEFRLVLNLNMMLSSWPSAAA